MAVKSGENTRTVIWFRAALEMWVKHSGQNKTQAAASLGMTQGNLSNIMAGKRSVSIAAMEEIADKLNKNLLVMLAEGQAYIRGGKPLVVTDTPSDTSKAGGSPLDRPDSGQAAEAAKPDEWKDKYYQLLEKYVVLLERVEGGSANVGTASTHTVNYQKDKVA